MNDIKKNPNPIHYFSGNQLIYFYYDKPDI